MYIVPRLEQGFDCVDLEYATSKVVLLWSKSVLKTSSFVLQQLPVTRGDPASKVSWERFQ